MNSFLIHYKRLGYLRWRSPLARRRISLLPGFRVSAPNQVTERYPVVVFVHLGPAGPVLQVGDYLVSEEGDPRLWGHPDIRY